ncbi:MAG: hypothetical protein PWP04_708 [Candidatus Atribacteria bacterium]|nr:hypothetical protein [Candidatus Atribacteria bacterium]
MNVENIYSNNNIDNGKEETRDFIKEAEELLVDAENDLNRGDYKSCFSKSYQAMVFSLKALLNLLEKRLEKTEAEMLSREVENKFEDIHNQILLIGQETDFASNEKKVKEFLKVVGDFVQNLKNRFKTFSFPA